MNSIATVAAVGPRPDPRRLLAVLMLCGLVLALCGCGGARPAGEPVTTLPPDPQLPDRLYANLLEEHAAGRDRAALQLGHELIDHHPGFAKLDHALLLSATSADRLGDRPAALRLTGEFLDAHDASPYAPAVLSLRADLLAAAADTVGAADVLLRLHARSEEGLAREGATDRLADMAENLDADALGWLMNRHPESPLHPYLSYLRLHRLLGEGRTREAGEAARVMRVETPASEWLARAEELLREPGYVLAAAPPLRPLTGDVDPTHLGVICPLTQRYTVLGNAFYDGVLLAVTHANREGWRQYSLSVKDSGGDPVLAALAARRYAAEEKPIALIGALLSAPTVAAAITADGFGIPLVSPTATNDRIWEIGPAVFQTNLTGLFEARLLADLGVSVLLKQRFAVIHPDTPEGLRSHQVFADAVQALGGEIVAVEAFDPGTADFRDPLERIRAARPEVVYVPATVDQTMLLGPQLDFYRAGALVMGPSDWNSPRLTREAGRILERAVFPSDTALFPEGWTEAFAADWHAENLPEEASTIALRSYLAARLVLFSLAERNIETREELAAALAERLAMRRAAEIDLDAAGASLRMYEKGRVVPFPMDLFAGVLDAPAAAPVDSVVADPVPPPPPGG